MSNINSNKSVLYFGTNYSEYSCINLKYVHCRHNIYITNCAEDIALVYYEGLVKPPHPITSRGLWRVILKITIVKMGKTKILNSGIIL